MICYGRRLWAEHEIVPVLRDSSRKRHPSMLVGPVCESGEFSSPGREMAAVGQANSWLCWISGAYGTVLGSN